MVIIGLLGKKGSGKTTVENYLHEKWNYHRLAFADALKKTILLWYPQLTENHLHDQELKEMKLESLGGKSPRQLMQSIGTELVRQQWDEEIWVNIVKRKIGQLKETNQNIVVSDVRMENEFDMLSQFNMSEKVIFLRIHRDDRQVKYDSHSTENQQMESPLIVEIDNNGSLEDLHRAIDEIIF